MSRNKLWQICHKKAASNRKVTESIVAVTREQKLTTKQIARDIIVSTARVRNWYYRGTGMTALDLLLLMHEYECVRVWVENMLIECTCFKGSEMV